MSAAPTVVSTPSQSIRLGQTLSFTLPANSFIDPQHQSLTYKASLSGGAILPSWLHFDPASETFSGKPTVAGVLALAVTATDSGGLSATDHFNLTVTGPPVLAKHEGNLLIVPNHVVNLTLSGEFTDPQHQSLTYSATESDGSALPSWLKFNGKTDSFTGKSPVSGAAGFGVIITATDSGGLSTTDYFHVTMVNMPSVVTTPDQSMIIGQTNSVSLPAQSFSDPQGQYLTYSASKANGAALPSWLKFNSATESFSGTPPANSASLAVEVTAKDVSGLVAHDIFNITFTTAHVGSEIAVIGVHGATSLGLHG